MSSNWPQVTLKDITSILGDGLHGTPEYDESGEYYFINGNNLNNGNIIITEKTKRASKSEYEKHKKDLNDRTILVSINGTLGNIAFYNGEKVFLGKSACYFNVIPDVDKHYIRYVLESGLFQDYIHNLATGSTIKNVSLKLMRDFSFKLPPKGIQKNISRVLKDLDDKIQTNIQTNQTLEQIAQAIFKSWFVDFDPVKAKIAVLEAGGTAAQAELAAMSAISAKDETALKQLQAEQPAAYAKLAQTAALFPSKMVDSELGEIPEGWEVTDFGSVSECFDRKRIPLSKRQREQRQGNVPYYGATSIMDYVDEAIFDDVFLLLGEDGSVLKEDGTPFIQYIWGPAWVNNHAHVLQGINGVSTEQLMIFIASQNILPYVTGAVQLKLNQKNMNSIPFIKAADGINFEFQNLIKPLYSSFRATCEQTLALTSIRDTLLPRLLSGEVDIHGD